MGYEKLVTLGKYLQACGKKSILETKQIGRVNASELGVCFPNGTITFATEESAKKYAKNRVIAALKEPKPFERTIVTSRNRVLDELNGDSMQGGALSIGKYKSLNDNVSVYHGHTDMHGEGITTPISLADYNVLKEFGDHVDEIVAYNSLGEFSRLKNIHQPQWLNKTFAIIRRLLQVGKCQRDFNNTILSPIKSEQRKLCKQAVQLMRNPNSAEEVLQEIEALTKQANELAINIQTSKEGIKAIHEFWSKASKKGKYGIEYSTNFHHLDDL